jgi:single-stranded-DNA-specific exonuclease
MSENAPAALPRFDWLSVADAPAAARELHGALGLPLPIANLLAARGYSDPDTARRFLAPVEQKLVDPFAIGHIQEAVDRLLRTIEAGGEIVVFGDFDVDGVVATALLTDIIRFLGGKVRPFLPDRHTEGYGLTEAALTRCLDLGTPALFVTVDCGMGATSLLAGLQARGIQLLLTDHHTLAGTFPDGCIVVNPHQDGTPEGAHHLCGAGVAFQLASGAIKQRGDRREERLRLFSWLEAVAIATVADVVPLLGDNRTLVAFGLQALNRKPRVGLVELMKKSGISNTDINSYHLGFILGPRLNAAGRMETALPALQLLTTDDRDEARALAIHLDDANAIRKATEQELLIRADGQLDSWFDAARHGAVVVGGEDWHAGTVGIVAARLMNQHHRPAAVVSLDAAGGGHGSVRAGHAYNAVAALAACAPHLERMGGHARAAGFTLKPGAFEAFRTAFAEACFAQVGAAACTPELMIDGWLAGTGIDQALVQGIQRLEPFGEGHPRPCWGLRNVTLRNPPQTLGADGEHLRLNLVTDDGLPLQAVWFRARPYLPLLADRQAPFDIAGEIQENTYGGNTTIQLVVRDVRLHA